MTTTATTGTAGTQPGPNPNTGIGGNNPPTPQQQAWLDSCTDFGAQAGAGDTSLIGWYQSTVQAAFRDEIEPDMAIAGTKHYQDSRRQRRAMLGKQATAGDGKADKVRESECRKMIKIGKLTVFRSVNNGGLGVFNRALKIIGDDVSLKGETAKHILKVMTEQLRKSDAPLDDDHIRSVLAPKESVDKGEGEFLLAAKKALEASAEKSSWEAHKRAALTSINARIEQINFKTAAQKKAEDKARAAEKAKKAAAKKAARTGAKGAAAAAP